MEPGRHEGVEHLLVALFGVGFPAITTPASAKRRAAILAGDRALRKREYRETIAWLSSMGLASIVFFVARGLEPSALGLSLPLTRGSLLSVTLALVASLVLHLQLRAVRVDAATRAAAREALEPVREYFPTFLFWYFGQWLPVSAALVLSSGLFGLAHVMHGAEATARSTAMGFVLGGLYLLGGSLLAPMILHTVVDLTSGETGAVAFADDREEDVEGGEGGDETSDA